MPKNNNGSLALSDFSKKVIKATGIVILMILLTLLFLKGFKVLLLILSGVLFATFFRGIAALLQKVLPLNEMWGLVLAVILVLGLFVGVGYALYPSVSEQTEKLEQELPKAAKDTEEKLKSSQIGRWFFTQLEKNKDQYNKDSQKITVFFSSFFGGLADIYIIFFLGIFFMVQPDIYKKGIIKLFPKQHREHASDILNTVGYTLKRWLLGKIFSMLVVGVLTGIGLSILGIPLALTLALFATLVTFIPNFGPIISLIPAFLLAFTKGTDYAIYVCLLYVGIQALESNIITPLIQRKMISFPLALILMAQVILGIFTGILGLILAVPIVAVVVVLIKTIYIKETLNDDSIEIKGSEL